MATFPKMSTVLMIVGLATCASLGCKRTAEAIAEKTVKAAKDVTAGLAEGIDKGRKAGESADGAVLVSSSDELRGKGNIGILTVRASDAGTSTEVDLVFENISDRPLRLTNIDFQGLDKDGFIKSPHATRSEVSIPPHAKEKLTLVFDERATSLAKLRYWTSELPLDRVHSRSGPAF